MRQSKTDFYKTEARSVVTKSLMSSISRHPQLLKDFPQQVQGVVCHLSISWVNHEKLGMSSSLMILILIKSWMKQHIILPAAFVSSRNTCSTRQSVICTQAFCTGLEEASSSLFSNCKSSKISCREDCNNKM